MNDLQTTSKNDKGCGIVRSLVWPLLFLLLFGLRAMAQSPEEIGISLRWDKEYGCQIANPEGPPDRKYEELIEQGACLRTCQNGTVTYSLYSSDTTGWGTAAWTVSGGVAVVSSDTYSCTVTWGTAGSGSIGAVIGTAAGDQIIPTLCIEIMPAPIAAFGVNSNGVPFRDLEACVDMDLQFINLSVPNGGSEIISYLWDFGDTTTSSALNPIHSYVAAGSYYARLTVKNACHCSSTVFEVKIKVSDGGLQLECPGVVCEGDRITYQLTGDMPGHCSFEENPWSVTGGSHGFMVSEATSIDVTWDDAPDSGFGEVRYNAQNCASGCASVAVLRIPIIRDQIPIVGEIRPCPGGQYRYSLPKWPSTDVQWSMTTTTGAVLILTDQPNEVIIQTSRTGVILLNAIYQNTLLLCGGTAITLEINVRKPLEILGPVAVCPGIRNYKLNNDNLGDWQVTHPDGSVHEVLNSNSLGTPLSGYLFEFPGTYTLSASSLNTCTMIPMKVVVRDLPETPLPEDNLHGKTVVCPGVPETYSFDNDVPGTTIGWKVLSGLNNLGAPVPGASFNGTKYGETVTINFNPSMEGVYHLQVWREYTTSPFCRSEVLDIPISKPPSNLHIVAANGEAGHFACPSSYETFTVFQIGSSDPYTDGEVYTWSLENPEAGSIITNGTNTVQILWNELSEEITTDVRLNIRKCGPMPVFTFEVTIRPVPEIGISVPELICSGTAIAPEVTYPPGYVVIPGSSTEWIVDGQSRGTDPSFTIFNTGSSNATHTIKAVVHHVSGCDLDVSTEVSVTVQGTLNIDLLPREDQYFCESFSQVFTLSPTPPTGTTIVWYKDGVVIPSVTGTTYTATTFGTYHVGLTYNGCTVGTNATKIISSCGPNGEGNTPCVFEGGLPTVTQLTTMLESCGHIRVDLVLSPAPISFDWSVNSPCNLCSATLDESDINDVEYTFSRAGWYNITYLATYPAVGGGTCDMWVTIPIEIPFTAQVEEKVTCGSGGYELTLKDVSPTYNTSITHRVFYIDGVPYAQAGDTKVVTFATGGTHTYKLEVYDDNIAHPHCTTQTFTLVLPALPDAHFTYTSATCSSSCGEVCSNKSIKLHVTQPHSAGQTYLWDFGDGTTNTQREPDKTYQQLAEDTDYLITLTITNQFGCETFEVNPVTVRSNRLSGTIGVSPEIACEDDDIILTYNPGGGSATPDYFTWMNGTAVVHSGAEDSFTISNNISGAYWVKVKDAYGCTNQTFPGNAAFVMVPEAQITGPNRVCAGKPFALSGYAAAAGSGIQYQWSLNGDIIADYPGTAMLAQVADADPGSMVYGLTLRIPKGPSSSDYCYSEYVREVGLY